MIKKATLIKILASVILAIYVVKVSAQTIDVDVPIGWAVVSGYGLESTTGGANGETVVAKTFEELKSYAGQSAPLTIIIEGTLNGGGGTVGRCDIKSDKTIMGVGSDATIKGIELNISGEHNIIIRNLTIKDSRDGIATRRSHHVWIDHCDVSHCDDGAIDITDQADLHTVSWTRLSDHDKTMLINSGADGHEEDEGYLNTTLHHMWWDGSNQRNPRVGYGKVHVFNCQYNRSTQEDPDYGIGLHTRALVLAENNYFDGVRNPIHQMYRPDPADYYHGYCESVGNIFNKTSGDHNDEGISFSVNDYYLYDFIIDHASDVPTIVKAGAGPAEQFGKLGLLPTPGQGSITNSSTLKWTKGDSATSYIVSFGTTSNPTIIDTVDVQEYNLEGLQDGTDYFWKIDQITATGLVEGKLWMFRTAGVVPGWPSVSISSPKEFITIDEGEVIEIEAEATDSDGTVSSVEFFDGKISLGVDNSSPFNATLSKASKGTHMIKASVKDNEGNTYTSDVEFLDVRYRIKGLDDSYKYIAANNSTFETSVVVNVAYGGNGLFNYMYSVAGSVDCNSKVFGDPNPGDSKACYAEPSPIPFVIYVKSNEGKDFKAPAKITFYALAFDNEEALDSVEFFNNDILIGAVDVKSNRLATFIWKDVSDGDYNITAKVTDSDGNSSSTEVMKVSVNGGVGVSDFNNEAITLFPNPVSDELIINMLNYSGKTNIILSNSQGQIIRNETFNGSEHLIDLKSFPKGAYNITLSNDEGKVVRKIIKK